MKRILSFSLLLLAFVLTLICSVRPAQAAEIEASGICYGSDLTWELDTEGTLTISGAGPMPDYLHYSAPWYFDYTLCEPFITAVVIEPGVTAIGNYAFPECEALTSVTIADTVTSIGEGAFFRCRYLPEIDIPDSVTSIGSLAFSECTYLSEIEMPAGITTIGSEAFYYCTALKTVALPEGLTTIGEKAFYQCKKLSHVSIPSTVTQIDTLAFSECGYLESVTLAEGLGVLGEKMFCDSGLTEISIPGSVSIIPSGAFSGCPRLRHATLGEGVTEIASGAFYSSSLATISLPASLTAIRASAFENCDSLTDVTIPANISTIEGTVFKGCLSLTALKVDSANTALREVDGVLYTADLTTLAVIPGGWSGDLEIPDGVAVISENAAYGCINLTSVRFPASVTEYHNSAINNCPILLGLYFTGDAPVFHEKAFVQAVTVYYPADNPTWTEDVRQPYENTVLWQPFSDETRDSHSGIYVDAVWHLDPDGNLAVSGSGPFGASSAFAQVRHRVKSVTFADGITEIDSHTFVGCTDLTTVSLPDSLSSIDKYAFQGCTGLTEITFPDALDYIGEFAFQGCTGLTQASLPDSLQVIGKSAFSECAGLTSVSIPEGVTTLGTRAFNGCSSLTQLSIPGTVHTIDTGAFEYCSGLTSVVIHEGVTQIGNAAFGGCTSLTQVTFPDTLTTIYDFAFSDCIGLTSIAIPAGVASLDHRAFSGCSNISEYNVAEDNQHYRGIDGVLFSRDGTVLVLFPVSRAGSYTIPAGVTHIGTDAFRDSKELTAVTIPEGVEVLEDYCFCGCIALKDLVLPTTVNYIGYHSFANVRIPNLRFTGDQPEMNGWAFMYSIITAWIPNGNHTWSYLHPMFMDQWGTSIMRWIRYDNEQTQLPGDLNNDLAVNSDDAIYLLYHTLFGADTYPVSCNCDFDGSGCVDSDDAIYLLYHTLFGDSQYPLT